MTPSVSNIARQTIACIAFDFDGTLVDSNAIKYDAFFDVLQDNPKAFPYLNELLDHSYSETRHTIFAKVAKHLYPDDAERAAYHVVKYVEDYSFVTEKRVSESAEISGASAMLDRLRAKGFTLALVSATPTPSLLATVEKRGWRSKFCSIYGAPASKAENLRELIQTLGILPSQLIMVGDRKIDLEGSEAIKCPFIGLIRPDSDFTSTPRYTIQNLDDLDTMIEHISTEAANVLI